MKNLLSTGEVTGTHGLGGCMRIKSFSGEVKHFLKLKNAVLSDGRQTKKLVVESVRSAGKSALVKFKGIDDTSIARKYVNWTIWVPRGRAAFKRRKEYYVADLTGCAIFLERREVARVKAIFDSGSHTYLEIDRVGEKAIVLPFIDRYFGKVDIRKKRIEIREAWLLE